jgi:segregation and condensation protein A
MEPKPTRVLPESWRVCLPIFEGPLDLLLHLVRVNQVELSDIPVALVCDQFHEYLALMEELDLDVAGEYIYEASVLIQLKSKMLLPQATDEHGEPLEDPRQQLVERLLEYRRIQEAAQSLAEVHSVRRGVWSRRSPELRLITASDEASLELEEVSLFDLLRALDGVLGRYRREHPEPLVLAGESWSVRDQLLRLMKRIEGGRPVDLIEDLRSRSCRAEAVAAFLAVLEMARLAVVRLHQTASGALLLYRTSRVLAADELEAIQA